MSFKWISPADTKVEELTSALHHSCAEGAGIHQVLMVNVLLFSSCLPRVHDVPACSPKTVTFAVVIHPVKYLSISELCSQMLLWHAVQLGLLIRMTCYIINAFTLLISTHFVPELWRCENLRWWKRNSTPWCQGAREESPKWILRSVHSKFVFLQFDAIPTAKAGSGQLVLEVPKSCANAVPRLLNKLPRYRYYQRWPFKV